MNEPASTIDLSPAADLHQMETEAAVPLENMEHHSTFFGGHPFETAGKAIDHFNEVFAAWVKGLPEKAILVWRRLPVHHTSDNVTDGTKTTAITCRVSAFVRKVVREAEVMVGLGVDGGEPQPEQNEPALRTDGPTLAEYVAAGYAADSYPPRGYAVRAVPVETPPAPAGVFVGIAGDPPKPAEEPAPIVTALDELDTPAPTVAAAAEPQASVDTAEPETISSTGSSGPSEIAINQDGASEDSSEAAKVEEPKADAVAQVEQANADQAEQVAETAAEPAPK